MCWGTAATQPFPRGSSWYPRVFPKPAWPRGRHRVRPAQHSLLHSHSVHLRSPHSAPQRREGAQLEQGLLPELPSRPRVPVRAPASPGVTAGLSPPPPQHCPPAPLDGTTVTIRFLLRHSLQYSFCWLQTCEQQDKVRTNQAAAAPRSRRKPEAGSARCQGPTGRPSYSQRVI